MTPRGEPIVDQRAVDDDHDLAVTDYLMILLDDWRTLVVSIILCAGLALAYLVFAVPIYSASGTVQVSSNENADASDLLDLVGRGQPSPVESEVEILRSRRIVGRAVSALGLNLEVPIFPLTSDLAVSLGGRSPVSRDLAALRSLVHELTVEDWVEAPIPAVFTAGRDGSLKVRLADAPEVTVPPAGRFNGRGVAFTLQRSPRELPQKPVSVSILPNDLVSQQIGTSLSVQSIGGAKDTNLVRISFEHVDRRIARDLVNAVMDAYLVFTLEGRTEQADRSATFIEGQLKAIRENLEASEHEMQLFLEQRGAVQLPDQAKELIRTSADLEFEQRKTEVQENLLNVVTSEIRRAEKSRRAVSLTANFFDDDPLLTKAIEGLNELELKRAMLLADVQETHPMVSRSDEEIRLLRGKILELIKGARDRIADRRRAFGRSLEEVQAELSSFPDKEREMASLRRRLEVSQELFTFLMTKLEETRILKASTTTDKRIIDLATTAFQRSQPRRTTTLALAIFCGLVLGIGAVFLRRAIDPSIRDEDEAKALAPIPLYGAVPDFRLLGLDRVKGSAVQAIWQAPKGAGAEAFRTLRTNVEFSQVAGEALRVIQITSSQASEGKSTVIANLGAALAKAGHRVLIVDLDLRRPTQHQLWNLPRLPGISDYLVGRAELTPRRPEDFELDVLTAGNEPPESQRLLGSDRLGELIAHWRSVYDYVLLDTPPLLVADSLVISRHSDMVLFVVRPRTCQRASLRLASLTLERMDAVHGLIINGVITRRGGYYHYYRGSYYGSKPSDTQEG